MNDSREMLTATRGRSERSDTARNGQRETLSERVRSLRLQPDGHVAPRSAWLPWGLTVIALATAGVFGYRAYLVSPADLGARIEPATTAAGGAVPTSTQNLPQAPSQASANGDVALQSKGYVIAAHQIQLGPQVGGEIIWLDPNFKESAIYKKGDRLAEIDPVIYKAQTKSAEAAVRVAEINLQEVESGSALNEILAAKAQIGNLTARLELSRIDERNKRRAGLGTSRDDLEKASMQSIVEQATLDVQKATVTRLEVALEEKKTTTRAQLQQAQANLEAAAKQLRNCTILAPTTGVVLSKKAELGGYVNPLAFGGAGYLCEMADLRDLEVELDIQERDIAQVRTAQRCRIMPEAGQHDDEFLKTHAEGYLGYVSRRMPVANRSKGAVTVRVKVEIPANEQSGTYLLPDMGVLVTFLKQKK